MAEVIYNFSLLLIMLLSKEIQTAVHRMKLPLKYQRYCFLYKEFIFLTSTDWDNGLVFSGYPFTPKHCDIFSRALCVCVNAQCLCWCLTL